MIPTLLRKKIHPLVAKLTPAIKYFGCMGFFGEWMLLISSGMMVYSIGLRGEDQSVTWYRTRTVQGFCSVRYGTVFSDFKF